MTHQQLTVAEHADRAEGAANSTDNRVDLLHRDLTRLVIGCFFHVYNQLGYGFVESVYSHAFAVELALRGIAAQRELPITVVYRGVEVGAFKADLLVAEKVLLEIKVADHLTYAHERQALNYLHATGIQVALLLNFGPKPTFRRLVATARR